MGRLSRKIKIVKRRKRVVERGVAIDDEMIRALERQMDQQIAGRLVIGGEENASPPKLEEY